MSDTEERKNVQIDSIRKKNERALTDMKNYYNDITLNNLAMISTLKEEIKTKEDRLERNEQLLSSVQQVGMDGKAAKGPMEVEICKSAGFPGRILLGHTSVEGLLSRFCRRTRNWQSR